MFTSANSLNCKFLTKLKTIIILIEGPYMDFFTFEIECFMIFICRCYTNVFVSIVKYHTCEENIKRSYLWLRARRNFKIIFEGYSFFILSRLKPNIWPILGQNHLLLGHETFPKNLLNRLKPPWVKGWYKVWKNLNHRETILVSQKKTFSPKSDLLS